jgi:hypothetical protein
MSEPTIEEIRAWVETEIYLGDKYRRTAWDDDRRILTAIRDRLSAPPEGVSDLDKSELDLERELWLKTAKEKETLEAAIAAARDAEMGKVHFDGRLATLDGQVIGIENGEAGK